MAGTAVSLTLGSTQLSIPNAQPDANGNADVYYESVAKAATFLDQIGAQMNTVMDDVKADTTYLQQVNGLQNWQYDDWNDPTTAAQRTGALIQLGVISPDSAVSVAVTYTDTNGQTASASSDYILPIDAAGIAAAQAGHTPGGEGKIYVSTPPDRYWVWNGSTLLPANTAQKVYTPTPGQLATWQTQTNQQTWTNQLTQLSQDKQTYLQDLVSRLNQFLTWASNVLQRREALISDVLK